MDDILAEMTSLGSAAIAMFGAAFCLMRTRHSRVTRSFAILLMAIAVNNLLDAFAQLMSTLPSGYEAAAHCITWPSSFFLAPLFWLYVHVLTSSEEEMPMRLVRHFALPAASVVVTLMVLISPATIRETLFSIESALNSRRTMMLAVLMSLLQIAVFPQIAFYLVLILCRLLRFRVKLRDFYSSTERHELRWIYVIGSLSIAFWLAATLLLFGAIRFDSPPASFVILSSLTGFALVSALTLWGMRQRPPLAPDAVEDPAPIEERPPQKYEKSALSAEAAERLSRKLRGAMEVNQLHRDANLSLWALAKHIGASSNYVSQTLNEVIGESSLDFVNGYRIAEAKALLATTDGSVLNISYDVGFNARSSFYKAFKRHTGQTPTSYRKYMSQRDGMDDANGQLCET